MKYKKLCVILTFLFISANILIFSSKTKSDSISKEIFVDDDFYLYRDGTVEKPLETIGEALKIANDGDTIFIFGGNYNETLTIDKSINIVGSIDEGNTVISYGKIHRNTIIITADNVNFTGCYLTDGYGKLLSSIRGSLLRIYSTNVLIENNNFLNCQKELTYGINLDNCNNNIINNNNFTNISNGIYLFSSNTVEVVNNNVSNCANYGIEFKDSIYSNIYNNIIENNRYGIYTNDCTNLNISNNTINKNTFRGIGDFNGEYNLINNNTITYNNVDGIYLNSANSRIIDNTISGNSIGIKIDESNCIIYNNIVKDSISTGVSALSNSANNKIYYNNFTNNEVSGRDEGNNNWYYNMHGNYWDDYDEIDKNQDGIGDTPYTKAGVYDKYPLGIFLKPPNKPTDPTPADYQDNTGLKLTLRVKVTDPEADLMDVSFFRIENVSNEYVETLLGVDTNVQNENFASITFNLYFNTTFAWYANVTDGRQNNVSDIWFFITKARPQNNIPPVARANVSTIFIKKGQSVIFDASESNDPDGQIDYYRWNFGDNTSEILSLKPTHTFTKIGSYIVKLTVIDDNGTSDTDNLKIYVTEGSKIKPTANPGGPYTGYVGNILLFDGTKSETENVNIVNYTWEFNDGTIKYGGIITNQFSGEGIYIVTLTVTDDTGQTDSESIQITIVNPPQEETPGFEIIIILLALIIFVVTIKKSKKKS
jgi:parallel beta-helix repeat protein